jgi:phosphatidate cytidylyltransferase
MLKTRVITATVLLAVFLPILFLLPPIYINVLFLVMIILAAWEWSRLIAPGATRAALIYASLCFIAIAALLFFSNVDIDIALLLVAMVFWIVGAPLIMSRGTQLTLSKWQFFLAVLGLIVLPATWFALVFLREMGLLWLLTAMALVWVADIGAYFVGKAFGRRRLAPQLSPGKTVEGALGGIVLCCFFATLCALYLPPTATIFGAFAVSWGWLPMFLLVISLTALSIVGDLFESQLKRLSGVKDSSHLLPGHGGVLDRIDALLPTMPIVVLLVGLLK